MMVIAAAAIGSQAHAGELSSEAGFVKLSVDYNVTTSSGQNQNRQIRVRAEVDLTDDSNPIAAFDASSVVRNSSESWPWYGGKGNTVMRNTASAYGYVESFGSWPGLGNPVIGVELSTSSYTKLNVNGSREPPVEKSSEVGVSAYLMVVLSVSTGEPMSVWLWVYGEDGRDSGRYTVPAGALTIIR